MLLQVLYISLTSSIWVYKGIKNDETLQGRGKVGPRILSVLDDVEQWDSLVVASGTKEEGGGRREGGREGRREGGKEHVEMNCRE
jgi:hypothetical protein